jgi:RND family efflux transporter MFP subunit
MIPVPNRLIGRESSSTGEPAGPPRSVRRSVVVYGSQALVVLLALVGVLWAFGLLPGGKSVGPGNGSGSPRAVLSVSTAEVVQGAINGSAHLTGTVQSADPREVTPATAGKVTKLPIKEGSKVKAGQVVATLFDTDGALALNAASAQTNLAKVRQDLDRFEHPVADSTQLGQARAAVTSAQEILDDAHTKRDKAEADYDKARQNYDRAVSRASASASSSSASASRAAQSSSAAAAVPPATVTVTLTPSTAPTTAPTTATTKPTNAMAPGPVSTTSIAVRLVAYRASYPTPTDVTTATSDLAAAKTKRDAARDAATTAQENLHSAQRNLTAYEHLDPAAQAQIVQTRAQLVAAQSQLDIAKRNLAALTVTSPVAGTVTSVPLLVGATVTSSSVIAQIDSGGFEAKASAEAAVAGALQTHPATPVIVTETGMPRITARLRAVSPTTDTASDQTNVMFTLVPDKKTIVRPGATVGIDVTLPPGRGLVVPASAVVNDGPDTVVYAVSPARAAGSAAPSATAHRVKVTLVTADAAHALVEGAGLESGTPVVVTGQTQLTDGTRVVVLPADPGATRASTS